jgi:UDP-N-acetylmuramoyl-L-alanyl-D-glutamate--2,6-diaminopimelate ligase
MKLSDLIKNIEIKEIKGNDSLEISSLHIDSRHIEKGGLFFAVPGHLMDGHNFIDAAVGQSVAAVVCEVLPEDLDDKVTYVQVKDVRKSVGVMAAEFYGNPSQELKLVGVTGTNGKTTVADLLYQLFQKLGHTTGLLSTVENKIGDNVAPSNMTTPDPITTQKLLREMVDAKCTHVFMEVSSHALDQDRISGLVFDGAIFTNVTQDHLDYHNTFEEYLKAKRKFFDYLNEDAFALANSDDENGEFMLQNTKAKKQYYGLRQEDGAVTGELQFEGKLLANTFFGLKLEINEQLLETKMIGRFNAYNLLAVYGAAYLLGEKAENILDAMQDFAPPAGRFDHVEINGKVGIVDYAHTPDALENVLQTIHNIKSENQKVFTVVGCGGNRDVGKRGPMATIAQKYSDIALFTSDNPRDEDPRIIIDQMMEGVANPEDPEPDNVYKVVDREEAIRQAAERAGDGDIVLVAGKGHETYQEIKGVRRPFDDREVLEQALRELE